MENEIKLNNEILTKKILIYENSFLQSDQSLEEEETFCKLLKEKVNLNKIKKKRKRKSKKNMKKYQNCIWIINY
jgi:hypothetical protein